MKTSDSSVETSKTNRSLKGELLIPAFLLTCFLSYTISGFFSTVLPDISKSLKFSIGTTSQLSIISPAVGIIVGVALSALTIRFNHKWLYVSGIAFFAAGTIGYVLAQNFGALIVVYFFLGIGGALIGTMAYTQIGDLFPLERKGWIVGLLGSSRMTAIVVMGPLTGIISGIAGWRAPLLWFIIPLGVICLALGVVIVPSTQTQPESPAGSPRGESAGTLSLYAQALKKIFLNKSALACCLAAFFLVFVSMEPLYAVSFVRKEFSVSVSMGGILYGITAAGGIISAAVGGRLINRVGRKPISIIGITIAGVTAALFSFMPNLWACAALWFVSATSEYMAVPGFYSWVMELVPAFRGSMMSINGIFSASGSIVAVAIGGSLLNLYNNFHLVFVYGGLVSLVAIPLLLVAKDPCKLSPAQ